MLDFFQKFFSSSYIFDPIPDPESPLIFYSVFLFGAVILLGAWLYFMLKHSARWQAHSGLVHRFANLFTSVGLVGLLLTFFRREGIPYLSSRALLLVFLLATIVWLEIIVYYALVQYPKFKATLERQERFQKYLPHPKKKK